MEIMQYDIDSYDCIFVIGGALCAYLETKVPIVYYTDAVFSNMIDYYWFHVSNRRIIEGNTVQRLALKKADITVVASEWAKDGAEVDYKIDKEKVRVIHLGAGIHERKVSYTQNKAIINILFCGVDWERKGGETACRVLKELQKIDKEHEYILDLVGGMPKYKILDPNIHVWGLLDRNNEKERKKLVEIWEGADLLLLPTKAECAGIVFAEAAAQGIPSIAYNTGGVSDYVENGITGILMPQNAGADDFAVEISKLITNEKRINLMRKNAIEKYRRDLNWITFGEKVKSIIDDL